MESKNAVIIKCRGVILHGEKLFVVKHREHADFYQFEIKNEKIIWPTDLDLLKPNMLAYERVESTIPNSSFVMVDDSKLNLEIPMKKPWNWKAVHFEEFHDVDYIIKKL